MSTDRKIRILYAEDDDRGAKLTKIILEKAGFELEIAPDGVEAWKAYKAQKPDLLLIDLDMPKKDGLELIQMIRKVDQLTNIIVYTSYTDLNKEIAALDAGADIFINKELSPEKFISHMTRAGKRAKGYMNIPHLYQLSKHTAFNGITREITIDGITTQMKKIDGRFLHLLCAKNHEVMSKSELIYGIWNLSDKSKDTELKKYASRVRTYLKPDPTLQIECRDGGYILMTTTD